MTVTSTLTTSPPLSQELIDKILDLVSASRTDDTSQDLRHCALVSQTFRPRSQSHIFSLATIQGETRHRIRNLLNAIDANPDIAHYISELCLEFTGLEYAWIYEDPDFNSLLKRKFASDRPLRKLTIVADSTTDDGYSTITLGNHERLLHDFFLPFFSASITCLSLHRLLGVPIEFVTSCVNLTDLELLHVELNGSDEAKSSSAQTRPLEVKRLAHRLSRNALTKLLDQSSDVTHPASLDLSGLHEFTIFTDAQRNLDFEQKIIDGCSESLEKLRVITLQTSYNGIFHGSADLQHLSRLHLLHVHALFPEDGLDSVLRTVSSVRSHTLVDLIFEAKVSFSRPADPEIILEADWAGFCSEVTRVLSLEGSNFEFKMTYLYTDRHDMELQDHQSLLQSRCEDVMRRIRGEFHCLERDLGTNLIFLHELEYDTGFDFGFD